MRESIPAASTDAPVGLESVPTVDAQWPKAGDRLFVASTWAYDAPIARDPGERFYRMPMGYKRAGDLLVDQASRDLVDRSNVIYAALFCYRQAVELFLKKLLSDFAPIHLPASRKTHDLSVLWALFEDLVRQRGRADERGLSAVAALVAELHDADRKSDGFRYPTDHRDMPFAFGDRGIDLENLRDVMEGVANFFEAAHTAFMHEADIEAEMRRGLPY